MSADSLNVNARAVRLIAALICVAAHSGNLIADPIGQRAESPVQFNRDVRTILSDNCFACHGPDHNKRKAGLRLDVRDDALKPLKSGESAIIPGDVDHSALVARILTDDADDHMPPADSGKKLTPAQV